MIPEERLSTQVVPAPFLGSRGEFPITRTFDYEDGGIALQDPSEGLQFQTWRGYILNDQIILEAPGIPPFTAYTGTNLTEVSITFDQNMRPTFAFVEDGVAKLRWYDSVPEETVITTLGADHISPRVTLDDKHPLGITDSDVILAYVRAGNLYFRAQRDRFQVEYLLREDVPERLQVIGMNTGWRLQFRFEGED